MGEDTTSVIRSYYSRQEAEYGQLLLENAGIPSFVNADDCGGAMLCLTTGALLVVRTQDAEQANAVLAESENRPDAGTAEDDSAAPSASEK